MPTKTLETLLDELLTGKGFIRSGDTYEAAYPHSGRTYTISLLPKRKVQVTIRERNLKEGWSITTKRLSQDFLKSLEKTISWR